MDQIVLDRLRFDAIVGVLPGEQAVAQPLEMDVRMGLDLSEAAATGELGRSVDYAAVAEQLRFLAQQGRWRLLESLASAAARLLLAPPAVGEERAAVEEVEIVVRKPAILDGRATPGVRFVRRGAPLRAVVGPSGVRIELLEATPLSAAYRVHVAPGVRWEVPPGLALRVIAGTLGAASRRSGPGEELARRAGAVHNPGEDALCVLAVGAPFPPGYAAGGASG